MRGFAGKSVSLECHSRRNGATRPPFLPTTPVRSHTSSAYVTICKLRASDENLFVYSTSSQNSKRRIRQPVQSSQRRSDDVTCRLSTPKGSRSLRPRRLTGVQESFFARPLVRTRYDGAKVDCGVAIDRSLFASYAGPGLVV